jgi:HD-like signal output (HDOD) protein
MTAKSPTTHIDHFISPLPENPTRFHQGLRLQEDITSYLGDIVASDSDFSPSMRELINHSFHGSSSEVDTIQGALSGTDMNEFQNQLIASAMIRSFTGISSELIDMESFWRQAITTGVLAQAICRHVDILHSDRLFIAGMLHDVGRLIICLTLPRKAEEILYITGGDEGILAETEQDWLGFDHAEVGAELFKAWELPKGLQSVARYHHQPQLATDHEHDVAIVHIALVVAHTHLTTGLTLDEMLWTIEPSAWITTGLSVERLLPCLPEMLQRSDNVYAMVASLSKQKTA